MIHLRGITHKVYLTSRNVPKVGYIAGKIVNWGFWIFIFLAPFMLAPQEMQSSEIFLWIIVSTTVTTLVWLFLALHLTSNEYLNKILVKLNDEKIDELDNDDESNLEIGEEVRYIWLRGAKTDVSNSYEFCFGIFILSFLLFISISGGIEELRGEDRNFPICSDGLVLTDDDIMDGQEDCLEGEDEDPIIQLSRCNGMECDGVAGYLITDYIAKNYQFIMLLTSTTAIGAIFLVRTWTPLREMSVKEGTINKLSIGILSRAGLLAALTTAYSISMKISVGRSSPEQEAILYTVYILMVAGIVSFPFMASISLAERIVGKRVEKFNFSTHDFITIAEMELLELDNGVFEVRLIQDKVNDVTVLNKKNL